MPNQYPEPGAYVHPCEQQYAQPPPSVVPQVVSQQGPLELPPMFHPIPEHYLELLPRYNGEQEMTADEHLDAFVAYINKLNIQGEDVGMRLFVQSLVGETMKSFQSLAIASIHSWVMLEDWFNATWVR